MARHAHIGFLEDEGFLRGVDVEFRDLVTELNKVPYFGTYGVSCAGHCTVEEEEFTKPRRTVFRPSPWGHLGMLAMPEKPHVNDLIKIINEKASQEQDTQFGFEVFDKDQSRWIMVPYVEGIDMAPHILGRNYEGLIAVKFTLRLGSNGAYPNEIWEKYMGNAIPFQGYEELLVDNLTRYGQMKTFWNSLAEGVESFNQSHGFKTIDFSKKEFEK